MHQSGTYPLPESQLDRFLMRIQLGYPDKEAEISMLKTQLGDSQHEVKTVMDIAEFIELQGAVRQVHASDELLHYILRLVTFSRESNLFANPLSPRATKALLSSAKAWAFINNRDFLIPEDVQAILPAVAEHRLRSASSDFSAQGSLSKTLLEAIDPLAA
jgi:MoxR-like ATPase